MPGAKQARKLFPKQFKQDTDTGDIFKDVRWEQVSSLIMINF